MTGHTAATDAPASSELDQRYGRTPQKRRRDRMIAWAGAIAIVLTFAAWVIWVAFDGPGTTITARDIGHNVVDDRTVSISYEVTMPPGTAAECALQVQNEAHAIVGWKLVEIPPSERFTQSFTEIVRTTQLGVTGLIYQCWLA